MCPHGSFSVTLDVTALKYTHLYSQFPGNVAKRLQLLGVFADTLQVVVAELILGVDQREDSLHQPGPEL